MIPLALVLLASAPMPAGSAGLPVAAFASNQVWATDDGRSIAQLGLPPLTVFLLRASGGRPEVLEVPDRRCMFEAALAPQLDRVAYSIIRSDARLQNDPSLWAVVVVDTAGHEMVRFPGVRRFRWSPDGGRLALGYAHHDTNWTWTWDSLGIWRREGGSQQTFRRPAEDFHWGEGDTLYCLSSGHVRALDIARGRWSDIDHHGPDLSPDRRFSMQHDTPAASGTYLYDDRDSLNLSHCALYRHNAAPLGGYAPFWVRAPRVRHLMCTTIGEGPSAPPGQAGLETGLFDPRTLEMVMRFPGKPVVPTPDRGAVVVARGDTFAVVSLAAAREPERGRTVRVRMEVKVWGGGIRTLGSGSGSRLLGIWTHEVAAGEWLPDHADRGGWCDRQLRIARIIDPDHIEIELTSGGYVADRPGGPPGSSSAAATRGGLTPVSREPTHLRTPSNDGGYTIDLSIVD